MKARSSVGEHFSDAEGARGSTPLAPIMKDNNNPGDTRVIDHPTEKARSKGAIIGRQIVKSRLEFMETSIFIKNVNRLNRSNSWLK